MTAFRCIAIPTETAARFRATGTDDNGNVLRRMTATDGGGFPCRHCLCFARPGEAMLLGSYNLPRPRGIYWTPSPIFVHAEACARFSAANVVAPIISAGAEVDAPLERALVDPRTAFVNVHTARPGCLLSRVERQPEAGA